MIGSGGARAALERSAQGVSTLEFMDQLPEDELMAALAAADALLLHERPGMREMCVPSKLTTYFSAGRPVLAATDAGSAGAFEVGASGAGIVVEPGYPQALLEAVDALRTWDLDAVGESGFEYARTNLGERAALDRYGNWVRSLLDSSVNEGASDEA